MTENKKHKGEGHRGRLRDRFLQGGLEGFLDYEVVELLLTLGTPRKDCKPMAKEAVARFKSLRGVLSASTEELCQVPGIGPKTVLGIRLAYEVSRRFMEDQIIRTDPITSSTELFNYLSADMRDRDKECFMVILLDQKNRVQEARVLFEGTINETAVYPREVVKLAMNHNSASIMLAHNHPSGDTTPSPEDFTITRQIKDACELVGVRVVEHLIIGDNRFYSFAAHKYL